MRPVLTVVAAAVYHGADPDGECRKLLGNIQRAVVVPQPEVYLQPSGTTPIFSLDGRHNVARDRDWERDECGRSDRGQVVCQMEFTVKYDQAPQTQDRICLNVDCQLIGTSGPASSGYATANERLSSTK